MSGKKLRKLLLQSSQLDEVTHNTRSTVSAAQKKRRKQAVNKSKHVENNTIDTNKSTEDLKKEKDEKKLKSQLESFLFYDHAFSRRSEATNQSKKRKINELSKEQNDRLMMKLLGMDSTLCGGTQTNSRSSSSRNSRKKHEPTFDKKKAAKRKEIKNLRDLARQLKKKK